MTQGWPRGARQVFPNLTSQGLARVFLVEEWLSSGVEVFVTTLIGEASRYPECRFEQELTVGVI